jgi:hypothetical protein
VSHSWHKKGDLVRILHPYGLPGDPPIGTDEDPDLGIVLRRWDAVVYQRDSYDVLLRGRVMTVKHNYLMHVSLDKQSPCRRPGLDPSKPRVVGQPGDRDGSAATKPDRPVS